MNRTALSPTEVQTYFQRYIDKVPADIIFREGFSLGKKEVLTFFQGIPEEKWEYRYAPGKWTIKEVYQHIIDTERIFAYRMFRIARRDKTALMGYEQDDYVAPSLANRKSMNDLEKEYSVVRDGTISMVYSLTDEDLKAIGNANGNDMSARAAGFILLGHEMWHMDCIKERYLG